MIDRDNRGGASVIQAVLVFVVLILLVPLGGVHWVAYLRSVALGYGWSEAWSTVVAMVFVVLPALILLLAVVSTLLKKKVVGTGEG